MACFNPGTPYFVVTSAEARPIRFCQSSPAASSLCRCASQIAIVEYGAAFAYARIAPHAPTMNDGHSVGADPTST